MVRFGTYFRPKAYSTRPKLLYCGLKYMSHHDLVLMNIIVFFLQICRSISKDQEIIRKIFVHVFTYIPLPPIYPKLLAPTREILQWKSPKMLWACEKSRVHSPRFMNYIFQFFWQDRTEVLLWSSSIPSTRFWLLPALA